MLLLVLLVLWILLVAADGGVGPVSAGGHHWRRQLLLLVPGALEASPCVRTEAAVHVRRVWVHCVDLATGGGVAYARL